jgi:RNA polymerase sigma factor (sigma-70 family)
MNTLRREHEPDAALLRRYTQQRDPDAFTELARRYAKLIFSTAYRITENTAEAEDVAQECLFALAQSGDTIVSSIPAWLHSIATHRAWNVVRRKKTESSYRDQAAAATSEPGTRSDDALAWKEMSCIIDREIAALPDDLRLPLVLHYLEGKTQEQIAVELKLNQSTVSRRVDAGIDTLRERLKRAGVAAPLILLGALLRENAAQASEAPAAVMTAASKMAISGIGAKSATASVASYFIWIGIVSLLLGAVVAVFAFRTPGVSLPTKPAVTVAPAAVANPAPPAAAENDGIHLDDATRWTATAFAPGSVMPKRINLSLKNDSNQFLQPHLFHHTRFKLDDGPVALRFNFEISNSRTVLSSLKIAACFNSVGNLPRPDEPNAQLMLQLWTSSFISSHSNGVKSTQLDEHPSLLAGRHAMEVLISKQEVVTRVDGKQCYRGEHGIDAKTVQFLFGCVVSPQPDAMDLVIEDVAVGPTTLPAKETPEEHF